MPHDHQHDDHQHDDQHAHHHGHEHDQGIRGALRYLRWLPQMWRSDVNDAVVALVDPQPGERVVDIGAGMGAGTLRAAAAGAHVTAVEPTPFMRNLLRLRRLVSRRRTNVDVVDGSAEQLPIDASTAHAVWAVNTMHHWSDLEAGVAEIARVVRPGGRILLVDEEFTDPAHPEYERFGRRHEGDDHGFTMVEADRMGELARAAGLIDVAAGSRSVADRPATVVSARRATVDDG